MALYERILVPADRSARGRAALAHAATLAAAHEATLVGVAVVDVRQYVGVPVGATWTGVDDHLRAEATAALEAVEAAGAASGVPVETHLREGVPSEELVAFADGTGCDCIVVGTHGRRGVSRMLLGSLAERLVRTAPVPVTTVRVGCTLPAVPGGESTPPLSVAIEDAADGSEGFEAESTG